MLGGMRQAALLALALAIPAFAQEQSVPSCEVDHLEACHSCPELEVALKDELPGEGEYYHGALHNALFEAFFLDCMSVGKQLLERGVDPSVGGLFGSMAFTVSINWPHNNRAVNDRWLDLLLQYHIKVDITTYLDDLPALQVVANGDFEPDYPDIWQRLLEANK
jgi:hypothetical protein